MVQISSTITTPPSEGSYSVIEHLLCPLCQEKCTGRSTLERHLQSTHNVNKEGLDKLLMLVDPPAWTVDTTVGNHDKDNLKSTSSTPAATGSRETTPELNNGTIDTETDAIRIGEDGK